MLSTKGLRDMRVFTVEIPVEGDVPDKVTTRWCADTFKLSMSSVLTAIDRGNLPATRFGKAWVIDPADAVRLWAHRLPRPTKTAD